MRLFIRQLVIVIAVATAMVARGEVLDRVVASVNGKPVLLSQVDEQARFVAFLEARDPAAITDSDRATALDRLINQMLVREQISRADYVAPEAAVASRLEDIRRQLNVASDEQWRALLARYSIDEAELRSSVRAEVEQLQFVEARFRPTVQVTSQQIQQFYQAEYLPKMRERGAREAPLDEVRAQIEQVLAERQITAAMTSWIEALRSQNNIRVWASFAQAKQAAPAGNRK